MPVFELTEDYTNFPPAWLANPDGLLAIGGDLSVNRVLEAYKSGIFPWFNEDEVPLWWSPDPRFVLFPEKVKISKSMRQVLRRGKFRITFDRAFEEVMRSCASVVRPDQEGSWITEQMVATFTELHKMGFSHSVEVWNGEELVGGLYGGVIGKCFFGESMFARESNASKAGFIVLAQNLQRLGFEIIDCQVHTDHLESMGAEFISRDAFLDTVYRNQPFDIVSQSWDGLMEPTAKLPNT